MQAPIYLDHAAATPLDSTVLQAMLPYMTTEYFNASAQYLAARQVRKDIDAARARLAHWIGARPSEITFTAGGTEANNLAIHGVMSRFPEGNIVASAIEHDAVLAPASKYDCRIVRVNQQGIVDIDHMKLLIDDQTVIVSVMYANNEIGAIQPIREIAVYLQEVRRQRGPHGLPIYFHTDACQAGAYLDLHAARLGVDMLTLNAGKIYGPKQTGLLYVRAGVALDPLIRGGGQERSLRSGTENVAGIVGFASALDLVQGRRQEEIARLKELQALFCRSLAEQMPTATINGSLKHRLPNNLHITIPGHDNERLMMLLDEQGIMVAVGSACSASSQEPSHVLRAIGLSDAEAQSSLRITMGHSTDRLAVERVVSALAAAIT